MLDDLARVRELLVEGYGDRAIARILSEETGAHVTRNWVRTAQLKLANAGRGGEIALPDPKTAPEFADRVLRCWRQSFSSFMEAGQWLIKAKAGLVHGEFLKMIGEMLPFTPSTAQRLMAIASDQRLSNPAHAQYLPPHWGTLYEIHKLDDDAFQARIEDGTIRPDMERKAITAIVKKERRTERESKLGAKQYALPQKRYGVILADPEWNFETWSENGQDRASGNHYATSSTDVIASRDVASIAADDCVLFMWATAPMLPQALMVMASWGFQYKSHMIWDKIITGTGYWFRNRHEMLLVGTRGNIDAPAAGTQWESIQDSIKGRHSQKPDWQYKLIAELFPSLPKIELNARADNPPPTGWDVWGNEAPATEAAE